jgi:Mce-associated membrane protein
VAPVLAIVVLVAAALLEAAYLWGPLADDPKVSAGRPVVVSEAAQRSVVDAAAQAAVTFSGRSYETYDEQVDAATSTMTAAFAEEYRQTTDQVRDEWIAGKTIVVAELEAQAVITASEKQVEALIFLTQFIEREGAQTAVTPYRLKVTMVETEQGWLVSDVESA